MVKYLWHEILESVYTQIRCGYWSVYSRVDLGP